MWNVKRKYFHLSRFCHHEIPHAFSISTVSVIMLKHFKKSFLNFLFQHSVFSLLFSSVHFSCSVMSNSLQPHGLQHTGLPCPSPTPRACSTHVHRLGDAIQPSHPLLSPSPPAFNLSQHQGLFQWVSSSHQVAKVLEFHLQHQSFQWIFRTDIL